MLLNQRRSKIHIYHLDHEGRAVKLSDDSGTAGDINDNADPTALARAHRAVANLEAEGHDSRLGTALRQVIDHYRGSSLAAVIMFTDGVTTETRRFSKSATMPPKKACRCSLSASATTTRSAT